MSNENRLSPEYTPTRDERTLAILVHVLSIFFWIFPGLILYLAKRDDSPYVAEHAREALNFQITMTLVAIALAITLVGILFLWVPGIIDFVLCIVAAIRAGDPRNAERRRRDRPVRARASRCRRGHGPRESPAELTHRARRGRVGGPQPDRALP